MRLLAIDPGLDTGWCVLQDGVVDGCGLDWAGNQGAKVAVLEKPQIYRQAKSKGDPNDLITLAIQLGRYVDRLENAGLRCKLVLPNHWKGQVPKEVHHRRVIKQLSPVEAARVAVALEPLAETKRHNVLDAVALAKWAHAEKLFGR